MPASGSHSSWQTDVRMLAASVAGVAFVTVVYDAVLHVTNSTTVALTYLLVVLLVAAAARLWIAVITACAAMLAFNFFFLPPVGRLVIADPQNWVALAVFLAVSLVASRLSSTAQDRQREAAARRDELGRLFDLSRDILLITDSAEARALLARLVARRFDMDYVAVCLPRAGDWDVFEAGSMRVALDRSLLTDAMSGAQTALEFDARARTYAGHRTITVEGELIRLVPLRLGTKAVGLLAVADRATEPGTIDAIAGLAAMAIERVQFLEERKDAELARQSEELKSALLASLGHDLRTPLTAIRLAASNLQSSWLSDADRREQSDVVLTEVERLTRLFQNILDMARIDAGAVASELRWVHPSEIIEAARDQVEHTLGTHQLDLAVDGDRLVRLDPRLTAAAVAHLLENAAQYGPADSPIEVSLRGEGDALVIRVRDRGPGIGAADLPHLFDRFYRGGEARKRVSGTGMGLSIARGLLAAERARIWAENCADGGARFSIAIPVEWKPADAAVAET